MVPPLRVLHKQFLILHAMFISLSRLADSNIVTVEVVRDRIIYDDPSVFAPSNAAACQLTPAISMAELYS